MRGRGEISNELGEVIGVVADKPTTDSLGKRYEAFGGWGMAPGKVEILLAVSCLMWTEVWKPSMSISRKVTYEREVV